MTRIPGRTLRVLAVVTFTLVLFACGGSEQDGNEPARAGFPPERAVPAPPLASTSVIRVVDGDTSKPVKGALVVTAGQKLRTGKTGSAGISGAPTRVRARISAKGYGARSVRVAFRQRAVATVELWRPSAQWPMYGANPARTQAHPGISLRPPFRRVWVRNLHSMLEFPAVVWEGVGYANNFRGVLTAFSMRDGRLVWRNHIGSLSASSPAVDPERGVLVTTTMKPGDVQIISMKTGRVRWRYPTGLAEASPVINKGVAYFGATNGNVYALDLDRRRPRWIYRGGVKITSSPALVGNRLYFGDYAGRVVALDARTGRVVWRGSAGTRVYGTVAVSGGRVFAPSVFSGLSALSAKTGRLLWRISSGAYMYASPAVYRGRIYFGTYAGYVASADARTGRVLWRRPAGGRVSGAVQIVAGVVYAASLDKRITAWHWRTGRTLWSFRQGRYVPVSGNGARLLIHGGKRIWAVEPKRRR